MNATFDCIVCGGEGREVVRNDLPMLLCDVCGLFWRKSFELNECHYEQRSFDLENKEKINARYANSLERIGTFRKYINMDNVCDVGCGEGIFLRALRDSGYQNTIGLEPSTEVCDFAVANKLEIFNGSIENLDKTFFNEHNVHTVTMFHVIEHLKDTKEVLTIIYDNLKKGDRLVIETPDTNSFVFTKTNYKNEFIYPEHLYYFNKNNLQKLLVGIGFTLIVSGSRDFKEKNLSIRQSLARLGFVDSPHQKQSEINAEQVDSGDKKINSGILRTIARRLLSILVKLMGRGNYLWIIVEK